LEDNVNSLQPHSHRSYDFSFGFIDQNTFLDAIFAEIRVEIGFCFIQNL
jgi:hypothetical protein